MRIVEIAIQELMKFDNDNMLNTLNKSIKTHTNNQGQLKSILQRDIIHYNRDCFLVLLTYLKQAIVHVHVCLKR